MKLNDLEKSQIRGLINSPQWATIQKVAELVVQEFRGENTLRDTEWESLRDTVLKEGRAQGVEQFFQELTRQSIDDK